MNARPPIDTIRNDAGLETLSRTGRLAAGFTHPARHAGGRPGDAFLDNQHSFILQGVPVDV